MDSSNSHSSALFRLTAIIISFFLLLISVNSKAAKHYTGVWESGKDGYYLWNGVSWKDFEKKWKELAKKDLRLVDIETYLDGGKRKYGGVWRSGKDGYYLWSGVSWKAFEKKWKELAKKNLRLIDIETYKVGKKRKYIGVWREGKSGYYLWAGSSWGEFNKKWKELAKKNLRLIDIETYMDGKKRKYIGVWRSGKDGYYLWAGVSWNEFNKKWKELAKKNLRLIDIEHYRVKGKTKYIGVWRSGNKGYYLWNNVDWENFQSKWVELGEKKQRLVDFEVLSGCKTKCTDQVVADKPYNYSITGHSTTYRWPVDDKGGKKYIRLSALAGKDKFLTLPFSDKKVGRNGIWRYSFDRDGVAGEDYHHAGDYSKGEATFSIKASAKGKVIHMGWDNWSGNTVILSHDVGKKKDAYRTIYMHVRNGKDNDCDMAWNNSVPNISGDSLKDYKAHLNNTGCSKKKSDRKLDETYWGTNKQTLNSKKLNKKVKRGDHIAWAGNTGPGGKRGASGGANTHLHIFWVRKDPTDNRWYFFDPYGIYATPNCYPKDVTGKLSSSCVRYPVLWKGGKPAYP